MKKILLFIMLFTGINCFASTSKVTLRQIIKYSEFVGIVETITVEKVAGCGYLVSGEVVKLYKGEEYKITFWVTSPKDINSYATKYFVSAAYRKEKTDNCMQSNLYTSKGYQSVFPFDINDEQYILANRKSFMTSLGGYHYAVDEFVKAFKVVDGRIHAMANWDRINEEIEILIQ